MQKNNKRIKTSTLFRRLFKSPNLQEFMDINETALEIPSFHIYITELCQSMNYVPAQVIKNSSIERTYGHQIFNGTRNPSRDKVIQLAFGFGLNVDGTQKLLKAAQKSLLYPKIKRDAAILYCINNNIDIIETQGVLESLGLTLLGGDEKHE
mgnify:FL=1